MTRDWYRLFVRPKDLRRHIARLRDWGYGLTTFRELARAVAGGRGHGLAALTFDDGFNDNLTMLVPLLKELDATATVFVVSGWMGKPHPEAPWARVMDAAGVRALHDAGLEVGAHTVTHPDLSTTGYEQALAELTGSKEELEEVIGDAVTSAAYPYGAANEAALRACRDAGFEAACRTSGRGSWDEPLNLPRQDVGNRQSALAFYLKRDDRYEPAMKPVHSVLASGPARFAVRVIRHYRSVLRP